MVLSSETLFLQFRGPILKAILGMAWGSHSYLPDIWEIAFGSLFPGSADLGIWAFGIMGSGDLGSGIWRLRVCL